MKVYRFAFLVGVLITNGYACSGDEPEEPVSDESGAEEAAAPPESGSEEAAPQESETAAPKDEEMPAPMPDEAAPAPEASMSAPAPTPAPAATADAGFEGAKVTRYVHTYAIHVRSAPDRSAPNVRYVKWGDKLDVVINGEWAKIGNNEFVVAKFLSDSAPTGPAPTAAGAHSKAKVKKVKKGKKKAKATK